MLLATGNQAFPDCHGFYVYLIVRITENVS